MRHRFVKADARQMDPCDRGEHVSVCEHSSLAGETEMTRRRKHQQQKHDKRGIKVYAWSRSSRVYTSRMIEQTRQDEARAVASPTCAYPQQRISPLSSNVTELSHNNSLCTFDRKLLLATHYHAPPIRRMVILSPASPSVLFEKIDRGTSKYENAIDLGLCIVQVKRTRVPCTGATRRLVTKVYNIPRSRMFRNRSASRPSLPSLRRKRFSTEFARHSWSRVSRTAGHDRDRTRRPAKPRTNKLDGVPGGRSTQHVLKEPLPQHAKRPPPPVPHLRPFDPIPTVRPYFRIKQWCSPANLILLGAPLANHCNRRVCVTLSCFN